MSTPQSNSKLLAKAKDARRMKKMASPTTPSRLLTSNSSFVATNNKGSGYAEGKHILTFEELQKSGVLTPAKTRARPGSSSLGDRIKSKTSSAPATRTAVPNPPQQQQQQQPSHGIGMIASSPSLKGRLKSSILDPAASDDDAAAAAAAAVDREIVKAAPSFASPVTRRTQRAAAKLAARRTTPNGSDNHEEMNESESKPEIERLRSEQTVACTAKANLSNDFGGEKKGCSTVEDTSTNHCKKSQQNRESTKLSSGGCGGEGGGAAGLGFASPPLSGARSTLSLKSSSKKKRGIARTSTEGSIVSPSSSSKGRTPLKNLPLSVQRELERKREAKMAAKSETDPNIESRQNLDKRTARLRYSGDFVAELAKHSLMSPVGSSKNGGDSSFSEEPSLDHYEQNGVCVFVRKRPIFKYEIDRGDFDVISVDRTNTVTVTNCTMHSDMRRRLVKPVHFPCTQAFDQNCTQEDIYEQIAKPLVQHATSSKRPGVSTILMFGQTGSGKTHTMSGIEARAAKGVFDEIESASGSQSGARVEVQFVELSGKCCKDLLGDTGEEVTLAEDKDGSVKLLNAESLRVNCPEELADAIAKGKSRRATEATDVNGVSSRSHAVCQIEITFEGRKRKGLLNLLDLAGSERRNDSMYHSGARQKESTEINASLWALKECTRARALASSSRKNGNVVIPYRSSNLTRLLRESFERDNARLCVIATVAPNATDTEHTMETLKFVSQLVGSDKNIREGESREVESVLQQKKPVELLPKVYSHEQLEAFLKRKKLKVKLPSKIDGKAIMKMSTSQMTGVLKCDAGTSSDIFNVLRKENDRVSKLHRKERISLSQARKEQAY